MAQDPRIDAYIAKAAPFARPIMTHVRSVVHATIPDLDETLKWSMPHFVYRGKNLAGFAAFKAHMAVMIHGDGRQGDAMGQYGKITQMSELPADADLAAKLLDAKARVDLEGTALKPKSAPRAPKAEIAMPDDFAAALDVAAARANFDGFSPSAQREYLEWVTEAKRVKTRASRIAQGTEWIAEGKKRNWKYENC
ncbi:MAG TPA: YdeI/OmpD-associated family protein [Novosphingobium sp.]|nr:YdeI/OmpD-associated family protein [Novosphingobium sp.]